jgi:hypothetical protein
LPHTAGIVRVSADDYHSKAAQFAAKARVETNPILQREYEGLAARYLRLAVHAELHPETDIVFVAPSAEAPESVQQQQQPQPDENKKDGD